MKIESWQIDEDATELAKAEYKSLFSEIRRLFKKIKGRHINKNISETNYSMKRKVSYLVY